MTPIKPCDYILMETMKKRPYFEQRLGKVSLSGKEQGDWHRWVSLAITAIYTAQEEAFIAGYKEGKSGCILEEEIDLSSRYDLFYQELINDPDSNSSS